MERYQNYTNGLPTQNFEEGSLVLHLSELNFYYFIAIDLISHENKTGRCIGAK